MSFEIVDMSFENFLDEVQDALVAKTGNLYESVCNACDLNKEDDFSLDDLNEDSLSALYCEKVRNEINKNISLLGLPKTEKYLCIPKNKKPFVWNVPYDIGTSISESEPNLSLKFNGNEPCFRYVVYSDGLDDLPIGSEGNIIPQSWCMEALQTKEFHDVLKNLENKSKEFSSFFDR